MDPFLDHSRVTGRLVEEWRQHKNLIIAYDFDNTVYDYHQKGYSYHMVIDLLRECKEIGAHLIVYTSCEEEKYPFITQYLKENNIPFDSINENPSFVPFKGKKLYYNILLDDRAGLRSAYEALLEAASIVRSENTK